MEIPYLILNCLSGNLIYHLDTAQPEGDAEAVNISGVGNGLSYLLKDPDGQVRCAAATAIPLLFKHNHLL